VSAICPQFRVKRIAELGVGSGEWGVGESKKRAVSLQEKSSAGTLSRTEL